MRRPWARGAARRGRCDLGVREGSAVSLRGCREASFLGEKKDNTPRPYPEVSLGCLCGERRGLGAAGSATVTGRGCLRAGHGTCVARPLWPAALRLGRRSGERGKRRRVAPRQRWEARPRPAGARAAAWGKLGAASRVRRRRTGPRRCRRWGERTRAVPRQRAGTSEKFGGMKQAVTVRAGRGVPAAGGACALPGDRQPACVCVCSGRRCRRPRRGRGEGGAAVFRTPTLA